MAKQLIYINQCGFLTTLQDTGRTCALQYGISRAGAMDVLSAKLANTLVGNNLNEPVLEITQSPHCFTFLKETIIAFTGGGLQPVLNEKEIVLNEAIVISKNSMVVMRKQIPGFRLYLSVAGGFKADSFLNSHATDLLLQAGGFHGRTLKKEDILQQNNQPSALQNNFMNVLKNGVEIEVKQEVCYTPSTIVRVMKGVEWHLLNEASKLKITTTGFIVSAQSNRMGYRLKADDLKTNEPCEIVSSAVTQGTVQLTATGELIVLMADAQTIGGYPRILQVTAADLPIVAQMKPADEIQFQLISLQEAEALYLKQEEKLNQIQLFIQSMAS